MVAARAREIYDRQAKERQRLSEGRGKKGVEKLPHLNGDTGKSRDQAGAAVGVSGKYVDLATKVITKGTPALVNLHRRHLDDGQRAMAKAEYHRHLTEMAVIRRKTGKSEDGLAGGRGRKKNLVTNSSPKSSAPKSRDAAAKAAGVGVQTMQCAVNVSKNGVPELQQMVKDGKVAVSAAAEAVAR